jgi:hypothetical protein
MEANGPLPRPGKIALTSCWSPPGSAASPSIRRTSRIPYISGIPDHFVGISQGSIPTVLGFGLPTNDNTRPIRCTYRQPHRQRPLACGR